MLRSKEGQTQEPSKSLEKSVSLHTSVCEHSTDEFCIPVCLVLHVCVCVATVSCAGSLRCGETHQQCHFSVICYLLEWCN